MGCKPCCWSPLRSNWNWPVSDCQVKINLSSNSGDIIRIIQKILPISPWPLTEPWMRLSQRLYSKWPFVFPKAAMRFTNKEATFKANVRYLLFNVATFLALHRTCPPDHWVIFQTFSHTLINHTDCIFKLFDLVISELNNWIYIHKIYMPPRMPIFLPVWGQTFWYCKKKIVLLPARLPISASCRKNSNTI